MPRYYFHLRDGEDTLLDLEGREPDHDTVIPGAALREARGILSDDVLGGELRLAQHIDVEDAGGRMVHRIEFADAVRIVWPGNTRQA